jgi:hypothetical protein
MRLRSGAWPLAKSRVMGLLPPPCQRDGLNRDLSAVALSLIAPDCDALFRTAAAAGVTAVTTRFNYQSTNMRDAMRFMVMSGKRA